MGAALKPENVATDSDRPTPTAVTQEPKSNRTWSSNRETKETNIDLDLNLDGTGKIEIETGIGFLDHMLTALAFHSGMDLKLKCVGDLHVDDHHTAEDCALALGTAIDGALGKRTGIKRFGYAYAPLDEAMARTVIDLSGRPWPEIHLQLEREMVGTWACENITHFFQSFAMTLKCSLHVDVLRGTNDHHRAEAAFKSCAKALREALTRTEGEVPSTKGVL
jgi:imidazoleglycerol phosphate dehydratase HisB